MPQQVYTWIRRHPMAADGLLGLALLAGSADQLRISPVKFMVAAVMVNAALALGSVAAGAVVAVTDDGTGGAPGLVLRAATVDEVRDAVGYAARHRDVPLGIFSAGHGLSGRSLNDGGLVRHITPTFAADAAAMLESDASYFFQLRAVGGAVSDVPADATAYGWRDANFSAVAFGTRRSGLDAWWERLLPHLEGLYLSFESATGPEVLARAFPPRHLARLTELKRRYDPTGLFRDNFFIDPRLPAAR